RLALSDARRRRKVARQARAMPAAADAWQAGRITSTHMDVLARTRNAAGADDRFADIERALVTVAETGTPEDVESVARQWRDALDAERQDPTSLALRQWESRGLHLSDLLDGMMIQSGRADPEAAAYIRRAIDVEYEKQHKRDDPRTPAQQRMDALTGVCRSYLSHQGRGANRAQVIFLSDVPTFDGDAVGLCETDRGIRIAPETLRRVACDAFISTAVVDANSAVLDLGRATRTFTAEQYRALLVQYPTCTGPACSVPSSECEMHHIDWWDHNGRTDLGNGIPVCGQDHHLVHEQRWTVTRDAKTGIVNWYRPDGTHAHTAHPRRKPDAIPIHIPQPDRHLILARIRELKRQRTAAA
ncbi:MAG: hypothetical protein JWL83_922, partial [Actinomycetia bacterium]|nr:hypothetical protein [Actinomycetes bacterium]